MSWSPCPDPVPGDRAGAEAIEMLIVPRARPWRDGGGTQCFRSIWAMFWMLRVVRRRPLSPTSRLLRGIRASQRLGSIWGFARPDYSDALFNLALLLTGDEQHDIALPVWERFLDLTPSGREAQQARRLARLCRMQAPSRRSSHESGAQVTQG
jgi:hypothetical protein